MVRAKARAVRVKILDVGSSGIAASALLAQLRNVIAFLKSMDKSLATEGREKIKWVVKQMAIEPPLVLDVVPEPKAQALEREIDRHMAKVANGVVEMFADVQSDARVAGKYSQLSLQKAKHLCDFTIKESLPTEFNFSVYGNFQPLRITPQNGLLICKGFDKLLDIDNTFVEFGSVEGHIKKVAIKSDESCIWIKESQSGQEVKCVLRGETNKRLMAKNMEVLVTGNRIGFDGEVTYCNGEEIGHVLVEGIELFPPEHELPTLEEMYEPNYTEGLDPVTFVRRLRDE